jgi:hypothetical protein
MPATRAPGTREREELAVQTARGRARRPDRAGRSAKPSSAIVMPACPISRSLSVIGHGALLAAASGILNVA